MPGAVTHLKAAHVFLEITGIPLNQPLFFLGSVSPDSVNINGHAPKSVRWPAHLRDADLAVWECNAKKFYEENSGKVNESYLLGYIMHIITDIVWDREYDGPLFAVMYKNGVPKDELKKSRWREIDGYELRQKNTDWLKNALENLKQAEVVNIGTLLCEDISVWRGKILEKKYDNDIVSRYINDDLMDSFFESVCENMLRIIKI